MAEEPVTLPLRCLECHRPVAVTYQPGPGPRGEQQNQMQAWLRSFEVGTWHHIGNTWVIVDLLGRTTAQTIRNKASELMPTHSNLVLQVKVTDWATKSPGNGHPWLEQYLVD